MPQVAFLAVPLHSPQTMPLRAASIHSASQVDEMVDGQFGVVLICFDLKILNQLKL
jgi:hypothetical protein